MADHDDLPYIVVERQSGAAGPFLWGALLGAGAALLLAPRSGEETQREIRNSVTRLRRDAEDRVSDTREAVFGAVERTRDTVQERVDSVRDAIHTGTNQARDAVDAGRRAAHDTRTDLERRVADAKSAFREADMAAGPPRPVAEVIITEEIIIEEAGPPPGME